MVELGHVSAVIVWRLDRLSRNLGDLILLADRFGQSGVTLHSVTEIPICSLSLYLVQFGVAGTLLLATKSGRLQAGRRRSN